jgi:hypothetical protein
MRPLTAGFLLIMVLGIVWQPSFASLASLIGLELGLAWTHGIHEENKI